MNFYEGLKTTNNLDLNGLWTFCRVYLAMGYRGLT